MSAQSEIIAPRLAEIAARFRASIGTPDAEQWPLLLPLIMPLTVQQVSALSVRRIENWYRARNASCAMPCRDRRLHGCLIAQRDGGIVFLDADDAPDERRFTLAHEIAHFYLDYLEPRERVLTRYGEPIRPVLDGVRAPTLAESLDGILSGVPLGIHRHLLEKESPNSNAQVWRAESRADELGLELLAPAAMVMARMNPGDSYFECAAAARELLIESFGLPPAVAASYAARVARALTGGPSVLSSLGLD